MAGKADKVLMVWPATGRTMEASAAAFEANYQPEGWQLVEAPEPGPAAKATRKRAKATE